MGRSRSDPNFHLLVKQQQKQEAEEKFSRVLQELALARTKEHRCLSLCCSKKDGVNCLLSLMIVQS